MAITLKVAGGNTITGIPYTNQMNVQMALEAAYDTFVNPPNIPALSFWVEFFGTSNGVYLGYLVTQMDGTAQQGSMYWMFSINNVQATTGIDSTFLNDGDEIEFNYQAYSPTVHGHTIMKQVHALKSNPRTNIPQPKPTPPVSSKSEGIWAIIVKCIRRIIALIKG